MAEKRSPMEMLGDITVDTDSSRKLGDSSNAFDSLFVDTVFFTNSTNHFISASTWDTDFSKSIVSADGAGRLTVWVSELRPNSDSSTGLGSSTRFWANTYTDKLLLNATATLDGTSAGVVKVTGDLDMQLSEILNAKTENVGALPSAGNLGRVLYLTTDSHLYLDQG